METRKDIAENPYRVPVCSISMDEGVATVKIEMPGVTKEGLEVKVEGNELLILGNRNDENHEGIWLLRERNEFPYLKTFTIDETIDREKIDAAFTDGILNLKLRVKEAAKPRRIEIA